MDRDVRNSWQWSRRQQALGLLSIPRLCLKLMVANWDARDIALSFAWLKALLPHGIGDALKDRRIGEYSLHQEN